MFIKICIIEDTRMEEHMKSKIIINVLVILICVGIVVGLCFVYKALTTAEKEKLNTGTTAKEIVISNEPLYTLENYPIVDGSTATIPLAQAFEENFTGLSNLEIQHSKTHQAYTKLIDKEVDLILVVEPSEDDKEYAASKGVELELNKVVNEAFVFFINKDNPVESLTIEQIQKIYTGEITNWSEVGGNDAEIIAYQRPVNSGSQTAMENLVMQGLKLKEATTEDIAHGMSDIIDVVSDYDNGANSIRYSYYYYANTMYLGENIKMVSVEGVAPSNKTIQKEEYPIMTAYYAVTRKGDTNENTLKLLEAMLSPRGQKVVEKAGYVPVK